MKRYRPHLLVVLLLSFLILSGLDSWLRETLLDSRFKMLTRPASGGIVLIEIDPRSIGAVGTWPWPRSLHGRLLQQLEKAGATDIVFDVDFSTASTPAEDAAFAAALEAAGGSVVLPAFRQRVADRGDGHTLHVNKPVAAFAPYAWLALVNVLPDRDGVIRRYNFGAMIEGDFIPSVGAMLAGRHDQSAPSFRIDFGINPNSVPSVSYIDVLHGAPAVQAALRGKKVIVSGTAAELGDRFTVPNGRIMPGSLIQALAGESIAQGRALSVTSRSVTLAALAALMVAMALSWTRLRSSRRMIGLLGLALALEAGALVLQAFYPIVLDTSLILAAILAYGFVAGIDEIDLRGLLRLVAERRFERVAMALSDGLVCTDQAGRITMWNPGASAIFNYQGSDAVGKPFEFLLAPGIDTDDCRFSIAAIPSDRLHQPGGLVVELVGARRCGERFDLECSVSSWETTDGVQYGMILRDVSQRKRQQERIRYLAECDTVTGLPNRNRLLAKLEDRRARQTVQTMLLVIAVSRFQQINDLHGDVFADALSIEISRRLTSQVAASELVARLASDEFAIMITGDDDGASALGARIIADFRERPVVFGHHRRRISVFVGIACATDGSHAEELLGNAHFALTAAKAGTVPVTFVAAMRQAIETREALEVELRRALAQDEFELFYQPQIDLRTRKVIGAEALIRWRHPERGYVSPGEFMPVVNTTSLSEGVAAWVLETACGQAAAWQRLGHPLRIGINLSQSQFTIGDLVGDVARLLRDHAVRPDLIELEVTEDIILDTGDKAQDTLRGLRALGVKIAFDDFGTGYGSLTYLKAFPLDTIKIDQSFVKTLSPDTGDAAIVSATIDLGHALGLCVIAEGIEDETTALLLQRMGCDEGQGYLISRPVPVAVFEQNFLVAAESMVA